MSFKIGLEFPNSNFRPETSNFQAKSQPEMAQDGKKAGLHGKGSNLLIRWEIADPTSTPANTVSLGALMTPLVLQSSLYD